MPAATAVCHIVVKLNVNRSCWTDSATRVNTALIMVTIKPLMKSWVFRLKKFEVVFCIVYFFKEKILSVIAPATLSFFTLSRAACSSLCCRWTMHEEGMTRPPIKIVYRFIVNDFGKWFPMIKWISANGEVETDNKVGLFYWVVN